MNSEFRRIIRTNHQDYTLVILRLVFGVISIPHNITEITLFTGPEFYRTEIPSPVFSINLGIMVVESISALLLVFGFTGRVFAALSIGVLLYHLNMDGMFFFEMLPFGIGFLWIGNYKVYLLLIALGIVIIQRGSGPFSIDTLLIRRANREFDVVQ